MDELNQLKYTPPKKLQVPRSSINHVDLPDSIFNS